MKQSLYTFTLACMTIMLAVFAGFSSTTLAAETKPNSETTSEDTSEEDSQPTATMISNITQNCASIKQSLSQLQRADSRVRVYLGASYERIATSFINPLATRLARNNLTDSSLHSIQSEFSSAQDAFRFAYTDYMREMDTLIATDCLSRPDEFYEQLVIARARRETLRQSTVKLTTLTNQQLTAVQKLEASL